MPFVYSTMTASTAYTQWEKSPSDTHVMKRQVTIKGGANLMPHGVQAGIALVTPRGTATQVTDEELAFLEQDEHFKTHMKNGFIHVEGKRIAVDKVVGDMKSRDKSSPMTKADYEARGKKPPIVNSGETATLKTVRPSLRQGI